MSRIRVLVVDDSAFMRKVVSDLLTSDPMIEVIHKARNGIEGVNKVKELAPDVVTLDIEMPIMNGLDALEILMNNHPVPVIMLSSSTQEGSIETIRALELGAVDFIQKPSGSISLDIHKVQQQLIAKVKAAVNAKINRAKIHVATVSDEKCSIVAERLGKFDNSIKSLETSKSGQKISNIVAVGTSTGGPKALQILLTTFPTGFPAALLIVQHMPKGFTKSLASRLDSLCSIRVFEAQHGMRLEQGCAYIAPGDFHMEVGLNDERHFITQLNQNEPNGGHRPSVDTLFESLAKLEHPSKYAVVMTGMGKDGTKGVKALKRTGCKEAIAEDEETCVVYGMPKSAIHSGAIDRILPLPQIGPYLVKALQS